jgi:hypothetical protein
MNQEYRISMLRIGRKNLLCDEHNIYERLAKSLPVGMF